MDPTTKEELTKLIEKYFPDAEDIIVDDSATAADWRIGERTYSIYKQPQWYLSSRADREDWGTYADTCSDAIKNAVHEDWSDHGFFLAT